MEPIDGITRVREGMKPNGIWEEMTTDMVIFLMERAIKRELIKEFEIVEIHHAGDKMLFRWRKRFNPLTDEEYDKAYS